MFRDEPINVEADDEEEDDTDAFAAAAAAAAFVPISFSSSSSSSSITPPPAAAVPIIGDEDPEQPHHHFSTREFYETAYHKMCSKPPYEYYGANLNIVYIRHLCPINFLLPNVFTNIGYQCYPCFGTPLVMTRLPSTGALKRFDDLVKEETAQRQKLRAERTTMLGTVFPTFEFQNVDFEEAATELMSNPNNPFIHDFKYTNVAQMFSSEDDDDEEEEEEEEKLDPWFDVADRLTTRNMIVAEINQDRQTQSSRIYEETSPSSYTDTSSDDDDLSESDPAYMLKLLIRENVLLEHSRNNLLKQLEDLKRSTTPPPPPPPPPAPPASSECRLCEHNHLSTYKPNDLQTLEYYTELFFATEKLVSEFEKKKHLSLYNPTFRRIKSLLNESEARKTSVLKSLSVVNEKKKEETLTKKDEDYDSVFPLALENPSYKVLKRIEDELMSRADKSLSYREMIVKVARALVRCEENSLSFWYDLEHKYAEIDSRYRNYLQSQQAKLQRPSSFDTVTLLSFILREQELKDDVASLLETVLSMAQQEKSSYEKLLKDQVALEFIYQRRYKPIVGEGNGGPSVHTYFGDDRLY